MNNQEKYKEKCDNDHFPFSGNGKCGELVTGSDMLGHERVVSRLSVFFLSMCGVHAVLCFIIIVLGIYFFFEVCVCGNGGVHE